MCCGLSDVTERQRAEDAMRFLAEASMVLSASLDYEATLQRVADLCVGRLADWCVVDVLEGEEVRRLAVAHGDPEQLSWALEYARLYPVRRDDQWGVARVLRSGEAELYPAVSDELLRERSAGPEQLAALRRFGMTSALTVPLRLRDQVLGAITFIACEPRAAYGPEDLALAEELARRAALALDNARLYRELERAVRMRDEVISIVSHDLRSPLQTVSLSAEVLRRKTGEDKEVARYVTTIQAAIQRASRLIHDLFLVSQAEHGLLTVEPRPTVVAELLAEARDAVAEEARESQVELRLTVPADLPPVLADRERLLQVLLNLLANSLRFTVAGGEVEISARHQDEAVVVTVADSGAGIAEEHLPYLFEPFWRGPEGNGSGLGLTIARRIVEAHGGAISVASRRGSGTRVAFTTPLASPAAVAAG